MTKQKTKPKTKTKRTAKAPPAPLSVRTHPLQVGERIQFRTWDSMLAEYGMREWLDHIGCPKLFTSNMKHLCGTQATITKIDEGQPIDRSALQLTDFTATGRTTWEFSVAMVERIGPPTKAQLAEQRKRKAESVKALKSPTVKAVVQTFRDLPSAFGCQRQATIKLVEILTGAPIGSLIHQPK